MGKLIYLLVLPVFLLISCKQKKESSGTDLFSLKVIPAHGRLMSGDSIAQPVAIVAGKPKIVKAGKPLVIRANTNVIPAGKPTTNGTIEPPLCRPGKDGFLLPVKLTIQEHPVLAGTPEILVVKDASTREQNPGNFSYLSVSQGLKVAYINSIFQDAAGNLWLATVGGGVSKYDGKYFTNYTEKEGLCNNIVNHIVQDKKGNIWFATENGVSRFDGKTFTGFTENDGLPNNVFDRMLLDNVGNLWFGSNKGLIRYDGTTFLVYTEKQGLSNSTIHSLIEDKKGNIWIGTDKGVSKFDGVSFSNYSNKEGFPVIPVFSLIEDKAGSLWLGTYGQGVFRYDGQVLSHFTQGEGLSDNIVFSLAQDRQGYIWMGTKIGGLSRYDGVSFTHFTTNEGLSSNAVLSIMEDKSGTLWCGTYEGADRYDGKVFTHFTEKEGLCNKSVYSITQDTAGNLWLATFFGGISRYDGRSFYNYSVKQGLPDNQVLWLESLKNGDIWGGTKNAGVFRFDGKSFTCYSKKEGLSTNNIRCIIEDMEGNTWFGTDKGAIRFDGKRLTNFTKKEGFTDCNIYSMLQDLAGNVWFGTNGDGVFRFDGRYFLNFTKKEGLPDNAITKIIQDARGNLWFSTYEGAVIYDGKHFIDFTDQEGLSSNVIISMIQDKTGNFWFETGAGLSVLDTEKFSEILAKRDSLPVSDHVFIRNYSCEDGFLGLGSLRGAIFEDTAGTIWIGTIDMLTAYHPEGNLPDTIPPGIQLSGITLFNENVPWTRLQIPGKDLGENGAKDTNLVLANGVRLNKFKFDGLSPWYNIPQNLSLPYNNNYLTFNYIGITTKSPKKVRYKYLLEGIDENWSGVTSKTEAPYGNLPPGMYTFRVKARNGEGYWSKEFRYTFIIRPPWWLTWWAFSSYVIIILGGFAIFVKWRTASLLSAKKELEKTVKERTQEVEEEKKRVIAEKKQVEVKNEEISQKNKEITDNISYAQRIQSAILPNINLFYETFDQSFVLYKPKDIVSGDFYDYSNKDGKIIIVAADCTGHGVSGAFMSMIGSSLLNQIINEKGITEPATILKQLNTAVIEALNQNENESSDGMDVAVCCFDRDTNELQFSGANRPLWLIRKQEIIVFPPSKNPIGGLQLALERTFGNYQIQLQKDDTVYMFTDGYADQFGGNNGKKMMTAKFRETLLAIQTKTMEEQEKYLAAFFESWKGTHEQVDDVLVIGIRV